MESIYPVTVLSSELDGLAAAPTMSSPSANGFDFSLPGGRGDDAWLMCDFEAYLTATVDVFTAGNVCTLYCVSSMNGEDFVSAPTAALAAYYDSLKLGTFVMAGLADPYHERLKFIPANGVGPYAYLPAAKSYKFCLLNNSGRTFAATGNVVLATPILHYNRNLA